VALNRVTGNDPSAILGSLVANGHVYLQNANGVYFAPGAQVNVGSLVATTLDVDLGELMLGKLRMSGGSTASGAVENAGSIVAAPGGHVVLAAPVVANSGAIATPGGTSALVAGNAVEVDPLGSGLLSIRVPVSAVNARLAQSGSISADGGAVLLAAAANDAALRTVMQVGGVVRARSIESREGQIVLSGGSSGDVMVDGRLDASAGASGQGGTIKVLGDRVGLTGGARLDASGGAGGGTILVGGNWQGQGPEANASAAYVGSGVVLDASATGRGDGGTVVVWSDGHTAYSGQADARGGATGGDGGKVEVSGKGTLDFQGGADLTAPRGKTGSLLLDPGNLTVGAVADLNGDSTTGDDLVANVFAGDFGLANSQITATRVATLLGSADVTLQSQFTINVTAPLTVAAGGAATTLSLQTADLTIGAPMTLNNASLSATTTPTFTTQQITVNAAVTSNNSVSLTSPTITFNAPVTATNVSLAAGSIATQSAAGILTATNLALAGNGDYVVNAAPNRVTNLAMSGFIDVDLAVANAPGVPLVISGSADTVTIVGTDTDITQSLAPSGAITLGVGEGGPFAIGTVGSGNVTLNNPANDISGGIVFNVAGNMALRNAGFLGAQGSASGDVALVAGGIFSLDGDISGRNLDITGVGFQADDTLLLPSGGGRFVVRSSDWTQDFFNSPAFGTGATDINFIVLGGFTGTAPTTGNGFFTNRTGTIAPPNGDNPPVSKVYDGSPAFAFAQTGASATATLEDITVPVPFGVTNYSVTGSGAFTDENAGVNKGHTVGPTTDTVALSPTQGNVAYFGLQFAGYTRAPGPHVPGQPGNPVSQITPRPITAIGLDGIDRVYDGTTVVGVNASGASLAGTIGGDLVSLVATGATGTMADKNVGTNKPVAVTGLSLAGADAGNYTVTAAPGANATITPLAITSSGFTGVDRVYDGTTAVAVNAGAATLSGVIGGDSVAVAGGTGSVASKNVGVAKPVTVGAVTLSGADAANYTVTDTGGAVVTITPLGITSTGITGVDRTYDGTTAVAVDTGGATLNGTIAGDTVSLVTSGATGTLANKNVGTAKPVTVGGLALAGADAGNYTLVDASNATVDIAALVLTASGIIATDRVVDGTTTVQIDASGATVSGVLPGDTIAIDPTAATGSVANPDPGANKTVTVAGIVLTGPDAGNYAIGPVPVTPSGGPLAVTFLSVDQGNFEDIRFTKYLQAVSDAQDPFRRAMAEALASGFGKENIRKQLQRGLVFETGLAPPAVDIIEPAARPQSCTPPGGADLHCGK
jgi:hypothetical protein